MDYVRITQGLNDKGKLVPISQMFSDLTHDTDWYASLYYYNDEHYQSFQKTHSVAGIVGLTTDKLIFDFDSKHDIEAAQNDAKILVSRLINEYKFDENNIQVYYSGSKGIHIVVDIDTRITSRQVKSICLKMAKNLATLDPAIYNDSRIIRIVGTKHPQTGLYKIPIPINMLNDSIIKIKDAAKNPDGLGLEFDWGIQSLSKSLLVEEKLTVAKKAITPTQESEDLEIDWKNKPKEWRNCKYALLQGYFKEGKRNEASMIIVSTCKALGYDKETAYYLAKSALKKRETRYNIEFDKEELWETVVEPIYSPTHRGGQYTCKQEGWLHDYCESLGEHKCAVERDDSMGASDISSMFQNYADNYDANILTTGIEDLDKNPNCRFLVGTFNGIVASPGAGKCLGKNTPVMMYDGTIKLVQDIKVGDKLMGDDSTPRNVLSTCRGQDRLYKVKQNNGDDYIVNSHHILSLRGCSSKQNKFNHANKYDIEIKDYLNETANFKKRIKGYKVPVEFETKELQLDPYILGYWLGNGTATKPQCTVNKDHNSVIEYISTFSKDLNIKIKIKYRNGAATLDITGQKNKINPFTNLLKKYNVFKNKHIPHDYLTSDRKQRLALLAGLIDSDGYVSNKCYYEITQKNKVLAEQIVYLARSLGFKTSINKSFKKCQNFEGDFYFRINIHSDDFSEVPVKVPYKKLKKLVRQRKYDLTEIKIEDVGFGDYYGFELDGNHRFLLGDFTVTHNTSVCLGILRHLSKKGIPTLFFSYDMFHSMVYLRILQQLTGLQQDEVFKIFTSDPERATELKALVDQEFKNVNFCFTQGQTVDDIEDVLDATEAKTGEKIKLIIVDYNELVMSKFSDPVQAGSEVAQRLRQLANDKNVCVITLLQPSKMFANPAEEVDSYRAAKGSSSIAQSMTMMLGINRPGFNPQDPENDRFLTVTAVKNRNGPLFSVDMHWDGLRGVVRPLTHQEHIDLDGVRAEREARREEREESWRN